MDYGSFPVPPVFPDKVECEEISLASAPPPSLPPPDVFLPDAEINPDPAPTRPSSSIDLYPPPAPQTITDNDLIPRAQQSSILSVASQTPTMPTPLLRALRWWFGRQSAPTPFMTMVAPGALLWILPTRR